MMYPWLYTKVFMYGHVYAPLCLSITSCVYQHVHVHVHGFIMHAPIVIPTCNYTCAHTFIFNITHLYCPPTPPSLCLLITNIHTLSGSKLMHPIYNYFVDHDTFLLFTYMHSIIYNYPHYILPTSILSLTHAHNMHTLIYTV